MKRTIQYIINPHEDGMTVREYLTTKGYSHAVFVQLKKTEYGITCNGKWYYVTDHLATGDLLTIILDEGEVSSLIEPVSLPLDIVYEDEDLLIVNKPYGMPVHPSQGNHDNTLANAVMYYFHSRGIPYTFRCINRLDRDTTGLTILASHMLSGAILSRDMTYRRIHRIYLAIVAGDVDCFGTIEAPIARKDESTIERMVDWEHGETAITHYHKICTSNDLSLIALKLDTGRTHQIRVHMRSIGHPLIGDFLYNPKDLRMNRQALHSFCLTFTHPLNDQPLIYTAPLPSDMQELFPQVSYSELIDTVRNLFPVETL